MPSIYEEILDRLKKLEKRVQNPFCCFPGDTGDVLTITDGATGTVAFEPSGGGGGNTIYTGDDALTTDRIVGGNITHSLLFTEMTSITLNAQSGTINTILQVDPTDPSARLQYTDSGTGADSGFILGASRASIFSGNGSTNASVEVDTSGNIFLKPEGYTLSTIGYVFTLTDPTTGAGTWQTPNSAGYKELSDYYSLPANFSTQSIESITKSGATSSATITAVGPYDKFAVTGGDQTSFIKFNGVNRVDNNVKAKLRVKINTKGTTACLIGLGWEGFNSTQDTGSPFANKLYVNLTSTTVYEYYPFVDGSPLALTTFSQTGTFAVSGDIVELEYITDTVNGFDKFIITNVSTGRYIEANTGDHIMAERPCQQANPSIVLADGTFTILNYSFRSVLLSSPLIQFVGDSLGIGYDLNYQSQILYQLNNLGYQNVINSCGNGCYIYGINTTAIREVIKNKPKVVVLFHWLTIYYGEFEIGNANNTVYMAQWNGFVNALLGLNIKLILFKPQSWSLDPGTNCTQWNSFVDGQVADNPGNLIACDLTSITPTYDASTYHADAVYNTAITSVLIQTLKDNQLV